MEASSVGILRTHGLRKRYQMGEVTVDASRLYSLARIPGRRERHRLEVALPAGVRAFAFTFG